MKSLGWKIAALAAFCCLLLCCSAATAEDFFTLDVDILDMDQLNRNDYVAANLTASCQGIRVRKEVSRSSELAEPVRLSLTRMDTQTLLYDRDYGYQSNVFLSDAIYLPYGGNGTTPYLATLYVGDTVYAIPFMQTQPRLRFNSACTYGLRMRELGAGDDWLMGTMLDLNLLRQTGRMDLAVCASNAYVIGEATVLMQGEYVSVLLSFYDEARVELHSASVYLIADCASLRGDPAYSGVAPVSPGDWIDAAGADSALLYLPMQASYDSAGLSGFTDDPDGAVLQAQRALWEQNCAARRNQPEEEAPQGESFLPESWNESVWETPAPQEQLSPQEEIPRGW